MSDPEFVVDQILPLYEPHVISGPSGSGKTTLLLQIGRDWSRGENVFGFRSFPANYCIVACDRSNASLEAHMRRLGIDPSAVPHFSLIGRTGKEDHTIEAAVRITRAKFVPQVTHLFLDGFASLCGGKLNDAKDVTRFLRDTTQFLRDERLSMLGTLCSAKAREGSGYASPRDRIAGSASWSSNTDTKILIEPTHPEKVEDPYRFIYLLPQGLPPQRLHYKMEDGALVPCAEPILVSSLDAWLTTLAPGANFTTADAIEVAAAAGYSPETTKVWLRQQVDLGVVERTGRGHYLVPKAGCVM